MEQKEVPYCFYLNPICSIWKEPLLKARYYCDDQGWKIERGCHRRYIMAHLDHSDIKTYRLDLETQKYPANEKK